MHKQDFYPIIVLKKYFLNVLKKELNLKNTLLTPKWPPMQKVFTNKGFEFIKENRF
jgi:hypothetical protein